jgi:hypothetical protein
MRVDMVPGSAYDLVSTKEMDSHISGIHSKMDQFLRQAVVGVKPIRSTSGLQTATGTFLRLVVPGPESGYIWSVSRVTIGSTFLVPGPMLFRTGDPNGIIMSANLVPDGPSEMKNVYTFPASNMTVTFNKAQLLLQAGESLVAGLFDAGLAAHNFSLSFDAIEVPAEMIGKLLM